MFRLGLFLLFIFSLFLTSCTPVKEEIEAPSLETPALPDPTAPTGGEFSLSMYYPTQKNAYQAHPSFVVGTYINMGTIQYLYQGAHCESLIGSATNNLYATSIIFTVQLPAAGTYTFSSQAKDGLTGFYSGCSQTPLVYTLMPTPTPSGVTLHASTPSPGSYSPIVSVSGIPGNNTVKIYQDAACSIEVGSAQAPEVSSSSTLNVTSTIAVAGTYQIYAKTFNEAGLGSACSTSHATYTLVTPQTPDTFSFISPLSSPGFDSTPTIRVGVSMATVGTSVQLYSDASCATQIGSGVFFGSSADVTTSTLALGSYTFYAILSAGSARSACSSASLSYTLQALPAPSSISAVSPAVSSHYSSTPTLQVSGVGSGDTVYLYADHLCATSVGENNATSTTTTISITTPLPLGVTQFYTKRKNNYQLLSACSGSLFSYTRVSRLALNKNSEFTIGFSPKSGVLSDLDSDGISDLIIGANQSWSFNIFRGLSLGLFGSLENMSNQNNVEGVTSADFNNDGKMDMATIATSSSVFKIFLGNGDRTFQTPSSITFGSTQLYDLSSADLNGDGIIDIGLVAAYSLKIYLGAGDGTFTLSNSYTLPYRSDHLVIGDLNGDAFPEIVVSEFSSSKIEIFTNNGDGSMTSSGNPSTTGSPGRLLLADMNEDGFSDLVVSSFHDKIDIFINNGSGAFPTKNTVTTNLTYQYSLAVADMDSDGHQDIIISNGSVAPQLQIYFGLGNGHVDIPLASTLLNNPYHILVKDIDANGKSDLVSLESGKAEVFLNQ